MKQKLLIILLLFPIMASAQDDNGWTRQMRFGLNGYPMTESVIHTWSKCDCVGEIGRSLSDVYFDYQKPMYTTGGISAEIAWLHKDWFTFALTMSANFTWQDNMNAVTHERTNTDTSLFLYVIPQARFNWLRRDLVKMYSSVGLGMITGYDLNKDFSVFPAFQINPVGIEVGRKVFGFCELGVGMMYTGAMAGVGFRF